MQENVATKNKQVTPLLPYIALLISFAQIAADASPVAYNILYF